MILNLEETSLGIVSWGETPQEDFETNLETILEIDKVMLENVTENKH